MADKDLIRLKHMLDSSKAALSFVRKRTRKSLDTNRLLVSAIIRELEILGEAAGKISQTTKDKFPKLPWKQLVGMRNRLIHAYFDVDHDVVWKTVKDYLPNFCKELESIIASFDS